MNTKALITLEYDKIIKKLETFASSTMGKALCKTCFPPLITKKSCQHRQKQKMH